jgi:hypothetical protein
MLRVRLVDNKGTYTKLSVFDFDGTLFKSPEKPKGFKGNWWISKESLGEPNVPEEPDDNFWNMDVVQVANNELNNNSTFCCMMTGRVGAAFEDRIKDLLSQKSLNFALTKFNEFGGDTGQYKVEEIKKLLKKYPSIQFIEMWEDDQEKVELYKEHFSASYKFKINKI